MARRRKMDSTSGRSERSKRHRSNNDPPIEIKPVQRNAANARERARMRVLSKAFSRLKTTLPWVPADTKLSKLDTLRLATNYIAHLRHILVDETCSADGQIIHPINLTWPFTFNAARAQDEDDENLSASVAVSMSMAASSSSSAPSSTAIGLQMDQGQSELVHQSLLRSSKTECAP